MRSRAYVVGVVFILSMLVVTACGGTGASAQPVPSSTAAPADTPVTAPVDSSQVVTVDMNGQTVTLKVGERFLLKLGEGYDWSPIVDDQTIVSRVPNIAVIRGAQGLYEAHKAGTTTLTAKGDPQCRTAQPACALPSIVFKVTVVVE
jgi:hypothetical protein